MLFAGSKKEAIAIHKRTVDKYNTVFADFQHKCEQLYSMRQLGVAQIKHIEYFINSIAILRKSLKRIFLSLRTKELGFVQQKSTLRKPIRPL